MQFLKLTKNTFLWLKNTRKCISRCIFPAANSLGKQGHLSWKPHDAAPCGFARLNLDCCSFCLMCIGSSEKCRGWCKFMRVRQTASRIKTQYFHRGDHKIWWNPNWVSAPLAPLSLTKRRVQVAILAEMETRHRPKECISFFPGYAACRLFLARFYIFNETV